MELILDQDENLKFEIDLGWTTAGKANPVEWIERYKNRIIACHLKDFFQIKICLIIQINHQLEKDLLIGKNY